MLERARVPRPSTRSCIFRRSAEEVASASLVEAQGPQHETFLTLSEEVTALSEEVDALRRALQRLSAAVMWRTATSVREDGAGRRE